MKMYIFCLFLFVFLCISTGYSQVHGNMFYKKETSVPSSVIETNITDDQRLKIEVNGLMNIKAGSYVAVFNVIQVGETPEQTDQLFANRLTQFKKAIQETNLSGIEFKIDMISFVPRYSIETENKIFSKSHNEVPAGFELQKNILIHYKHSSQLDAIVSAATRAEIYDLAKVDYFVPNLSKSLDSLRTRCLQEVKNKMKMYQSLGFKLDSLPKTVADDFKVVYPQSRYTSYQAFSRPSLTSFRKKPLAESDIKEIHTSASQVYTPLNYDNYDLVLNPGITEPVVQLSYTIQLHYHINSPQPPTDAKKYYFITPVGEIKPFLAPE